MPEERPSNRRLGRAAVLIIGIVLAIVAVIFVFFNASHYKAMQNEQAVENQAAQTR
ncbi:hypothetical protein [Sphingomonas sp. DT-204]|uniref:hypothetical protein n=1 Tax=Sphingomonas sp. DT-204 TaxID=3396166 RepID=UPI003F1DDBE3